VGDVAHPLGQPYRYPTQSLPLREDMSAKNRPASFSISGLLLVTALASVLLAYCISLRHVEKLKARLTASNSLLAQTRSDILEFHPEVFAEEYLGQDIGQFPLLKVLATKTTLTATEFDQRFRNLKEFSPRISVSEIPRCWEIFDIAPCRIHQYELHGGSFGPENSHGRLRIFEQRGLVLLVRTSW